MTHEQGGEAADERGPWPAPRDRGVAMDDRWFATYQHLERARLEAYELAVNAPGDRLNEYATLSARWRALADFWQQVRDDAATTFLMRDAAESSRAYAVLRANEVSLAAQDVPEGAE